METDRRVYIHYTDTPLGSMMMAGGDEGLAGLWFEGQKYMPVIPEGSAEYKIIPVFRRTEEWLSIYFSGRDPGFIPELSPQGTPFRKEVWDILLTIPYGQTMTYGDIAAVIASRRGLERSSAQAVGGAVGHNPISLIIPCHRVIGAGGDLTGYAGGLHRKERLLAMEMDMHNTII